MPKKFTQQQILIIIGGLVIVVGLLYLLFSGANSKKQVQQKTTITVWGIEPSKVFSDLIVSYTAFRKNASVNYVSVDPSQYYNKLLTALATGNGPDVFEIGNRDLPKWKSALSPMSTSTFGNQFDLAKLESYFPNVVESDFVSDGQIYGLPLSIDTLAMIYNSDFLNSAGIANPPKTWDEFDADVQKLRILDPSGKIIRAGAAIGGSEASIYNAPDILSLLMLQNGTTMIDQYKTSAQFANQGSSVNSGLSAFNFYLQFANAGSPYYTWNDSIGDATQSFINGNTAIIFDYESAIANIKNKAPFLNIGIAPMPQLSTTTFINYPKYNGLVASKLGNTSAAWDFILYLTTYTEGENIYVKDTGNPPAQRVAIATAESDPNLSVFATQALTAKSWYEADSSKIDSIFNLAIQQALSGSVSPQKALSVAQDSVTSLMSNNQ
jgi:multiple sugar transport system substrate-binding protein